MDPTGFAVGVVGLAGLVSTCIEAFAILRSMRAFSRDTEILFTKLDIEKELFLQWAQQVGLLKKHVVDRRLFDKRTDLLIYRVLKEVRVLLEEGRGMEGKYGGDGDGRDQKEGRRGVGYHYGEREKRGRYDEESEDEDMGKKVSFRRKFIWTVHGRDELKTLIDELGYFIGKLYQMIPSMEQRKASLKELRAAGGDVGTLSTLMLAEGRTDYGSRSDDGDWSNLASELASQAGERMTVSHQIRRRSRRQEDNDSEQDHGRRRRSRRRVGEYQQKRIRTGSEVSDYSHRSSGSHMSSGSYKSSRDTLVEMFGDIAGNNLRPQSTLR